MDKEQDRKTKHKPRAIVPPEVRFWRYVDKNDSGCWLWTASLNKWGYGQLYAGSLNGKRLTPFIAHRFSYQLNVGPIPEGLDLDHLCRVRSCVNPDHLEPVTRRENIVRGIGFCAENAKKTHCANGHPYDDENTRITKNGWRRCSACNRENARKHAWKYSTKRRDVHEP